MTNVEYVASFLELSDSSMQTINNSLGGQPLQYVIPSFRNYVYTVALPAAGMQVNVPIAAKFSSLKSLFGVKTKENSINLATDVMAVPSVRTMFEKLQLSDKHPQLLNDYSASINNVMFFNLDRGVRSVENDKKSVLSEQDGKLLTDSADMIISDMIDSLVTNRKNKGETKDLKSGTLGMLLEPEKRAFTFTYVKAAFKEKLDYFKTQLKKLNDKPSMSSYDSFQDILDNAVAVLVADKEVKKSTEDK
jgi:hypothetical protein